MCTLCKEITKYQASVAALATTVQPMRGYDPLCSVELAIPW